MTVDSELTSVNEEQLRANRFDLVSRLADDLAHEIKNPLNAIVINLEVLKVRVGRGDAEAALERAGVIEHEARRLHVMIDRLLQLLRPERDDAPGFALDRVLDELLPLMEARVRLARNSFAVECDTAIFVPVRRDHFKFAILNLLTAVHERMGENGGTLRLSCGTADDLVRISVVGERTAGATAPLEDDPGFARAISVVGELLSTPGARIEAIPGGACVHIPSGSGDGGGSDGDG